MTKREIWIAFAGLVLGGIIATVTADARRDHAQTAAHEQTITDEAHLAKVDTIRLDAEASAAASRVIFRRSTDTVLTHLTDTVRVKEFIAQAVQTVTKDSIALVADTAAINARDVVIRDVKQELALALSRPEPRLSARVGAFYNLANAEYSGSGDVTIRVIRNAGLTARIDAPLGARPSLLVGLTFRF